MRHIFSLIVIVIASYMNGVRVRLAAPEFVRIVWITMMLRMELVALMRLRISYDEWIITANTHQLNWSSIRLRIQWNSASAHTTVEVKTELQFTVYGMCVACSLLPIRELVVNSVAHPHGRWQGESIGSYGSKDRRTQRRCHHTNIFWFALRLFAQDEFLWMYSLYCSFSSSGIQTQASFMWYDRVFARLCV